MRYLRPRAITEEKNIILSVNEYKLPAWSHRVLQLAFQSEHSGELTTQLMVAAEFSDIQRSSEGPWFINLQQETYQIKCKKWWMMIKFWFERW